MLTVFQRWLYVAIAWRLHRNRDAFAPQTQRRYGAITIGCRPPLPYTNQHGTDKIYFRIASYSFYE